MTSAAVISDYLHRFKQTNLWWNGFEAKAAEIYLLVRQKKITAFDSEHFGLAVEQRLAVVWECGERFHALGFGDSVQVDRFLAELLRKREVSLELSEHHIAGPTNDRSDWLVEVDTASRHRFWTDAADEFRSSIDFWLISSYSCSGSSTAKPLLGSLPTHLESTFFCCQR